MQTWDVCCILGKGCNKGRIRDAPPAPGSLPEADLPPSSPVPSSILPSPSQKKKREHVRGGAASHRPKYWGRSVPRGPSAKISLDSRPGDRSGWTGGEVVFVCYTRSQTLKQYLRHDRDSTERKNVLLNVSLTYRKNLHCIPIITVITNCSLHIYTIVDLL